MPYMVHHSSHKALWIIFRVPIPNYLASQLEPFVPWGTSFPSLKPFIPWGTWFPSLKPKMPWGTWFRSLKTVRQIWGKKINEKKDSLRFKIEKLTGFEKIVNIKNMSFFKMIKESTIRFLSLTFWSRYGHFWVFEKFTKDWLSGHLWKLLCKNLSML